MQSITSCGNGSSNSTTSSSVKVGVRIRPLLAKERHQANIFNSISNHSDLSQNDLYSETAAPMLKSFMEGYNVTILAYGQTGSGKTFTMGTSDLNAVEDPDLQGLIPRFVQDLFNNLSSNSANGEELVETKISVSFLEIYGEDVYDLIGSATANGNRNERLSLQVREDEVGHVFVQGQLEVDVRNANNALELLCQGTRNRITGSTAMNSGSSRSHAVFTITLKQTLQSFNGGVEEDVHQMSSKLTFVDLAGSERIKRTGAEGQRLKEGIQINSGLFNLGQVINALADDQRLKQGTKQQFVPYRNSKLTHLLKDALGGNSQTLFLACVSPAECNESESHSTLNYAKQARNIQNKPVKNMDKSQLELRRLKYTIKAWMLKAVGNMFGSKAHSLDSSSLSLSPLPNVSPALKSKYLDGDDILRRPEVQEYINAVNSLIEEKLTGSTNSAISPRKVRLSVCGAPFSSPNCRPFQRSNSSRANQIAAADNDDHQYRPGCLADTLFNEESHINKKGGSNRESVLNVIGIRDSVFESQDPEETEKLVSRMLEMVSKEKEMCAIDMASEEEIVVLDQAIEEKEVILNKLLDTVKGYSVMKSDFEKLLNAIESLESERRELENELEKAKKSALNEDGHHANGLPTSSVAVERMKERFTKVKEELQKMRDERKNKENAYRMMQRESKQVDTLAKELSKLKESKVAMLKTQKAQSAHFQKLKKENTVKIASLKKSDVKKQRQMNTLKNELVKKERVLGHKDREIGRINSKLRACEDHITQLLKIQNKNRARINNPNGGNSSSSSNTDNGKSVLSEAEFTHLMTSRMMLDNLVAERIEKRRAKTLYDSKSRVLRELNKELVQEVCEMEELLSRSKAFASLDDDEDKPDYDEPTDLTDIKESIRVVENNIDRITRELDFYNADLDDLSARLEEKTQQATGCKGINDWDELGKEIIAAFSLSQFKPYVWDLIGEKAIAGEELATAYDALKTANDDVANANEKVSELENELNQLKAEMKSKLDKAELKRVEDMWSLLKASQPTSGDADDIVSTSSIVNRNDDAISIAIQRARDLEKELELVVISEENLKDQLYIQNEKLTDLENALNNERLRSLSSSNGSGSTGGQCFDALLSSWDTLGCSKEHRADVVDAILNASSVAHERAIADLNAYYDDTVTSIESKRVLLCAMCEVLGTDSTYYLEKANDIKLLLPRLEFLSVTIDQMNDSIVSRMSGIVALKERLLDLVAEMWIDIGELPMCLQVLIRLTSVDNTSADSAYDLVQQLHSFKCVLNDALLERWENEIKRLNVLRASITNKLVSLRVETIALATSLDVYEKQTLKTIIIDTHKDDESVLVEAKNTAISLLVSASPSNPPGSQQLLNALEHISIVLTGIKANRVAVTTIVSKLVNHINSSCQDSYNSINDVKSSDVPSRQLVAASMTEAASISTKSVQLRSELHQQTVALLKETKICEKEAIKLIQTLLDSSNSSDNAAVTCIEGLMTELRAALLFTEEEWIRIQVEAILSCWSNHKTVQTVREIIAIKAEKTRLTALSDAIAEIARLDVALTKHVSEMEDFELTSKQNRVALLNGNSKALVEEERFRKNGKRKYESISDKIVAAHAVIIKAVSATTIPVVFDISNYSTQTIALLKGKASERVELMHLHTTTHGTKRWSGDKDDILLDANASSENSNAAISSNISNIMLNETVPSTTSSSNVAKESNKHVSKVPIKVNSFRAAEAAPQRIAVSKNAKDGMIKSVSNLLAKKDVLQSKLL